MQACPNFESEKYKYLESKLGTLEAFKYWSQRQGDISHVLTGDEEKDIINEAKNLAKIHTGLGVYKDALVNNTAKALKEFGDQLAVSSIDAKEARRILGDRLADIAQLIHANQYLNPVSVNATMKIIGALRQDKFQKLFDRFFKSNPDKFYSELNQFAPKNQIELLKDWVKQNNPRSIGDMVAGLLADLSYTVEINEARGKTQDDKQWMDEAIANNDIDDIEYDRLNNSLRNTPTDYYAYLTVPGGTNYRENEIKTPNITPVRQGHAQFSTPNGIGWFRSDDQRIDDNSGKKVYDGAGGMVQLGVVAGNTRRILEIQSDLFQKERDTINLSRTEPDHESYDRGYISKEEFDKQTNSANKANDFLKLFNKDNNWITFFTKAIIQDSARKGYDNILFPSGDTAAKIEGHETVEQFIRGRQEMIKERKALMDAPSIGRFNAEGHKIFERNGSYFRTTSGDQFNSGVTEVEISKEDYERGVKEDRESDLREIEQFQKEIEDARVGRTKLSSIANFYENTIQNVLKKNGYNPERITDEHGNSWFKVDLNKDLSNKTIHFQTDPHNFKGLRINSILGALQSEGKLGKRIGPNRYEVVDPEGSNPLDLQRRALEVQEMINKETGKEFIRVSMNPNGASIMVNPDSLKAVNTLDAIDVQHYEDFLMDRLYTNKQTPTTSELINNAAVLAKQLGRQDLTNMARLIYKYLGKNTSLSARVIDKMNVEGTSGNQTKAYYNRVSNRVTFAKDRIGTGTLENEAETVLHELLHGLTFQPWFKESEKVALTPDESVFKHVVESYYNYFKGKQGANLNRHAFLDPEEFLMGALFDPSFKDHLRDIGSNDERESRFTRFMKDLLKGFLKLFGISANNDTVDQIDPSKFEGDLFDALSSYLDKTPRISMFNALKEDGRNYGLSFAVTADADYESEREKMKGKFTPELKENVKKMIEKSILSIKSFGSSIRSRLPESQEGFKTIFNQLKKLEDAQHNLDHVDFFFDFSSEIASIMNIANDKISKLQADETINDPDFKLKEYESIVSAIRNFDPILSDIEKVKISMENAGMGKYVNDINDMLIKRSRIEQVYSTGILPLVTSKMVDILSPATKKALEISNTKLDKLNESLQLATRKGVKARIKQLEKQIEEEKKFMQTKIVGDSDKIESLLRGELGDSHLLTTWAMAGVSNGNQIVSSLSKYIRDNVGEIAPWVLSTQNSFQDHVESYENTTGRSKNNTTTFNKPLVQTHQEIDGKDDKGEYKYKDVLSLMNQFNGKHIIELQKFARRSADLYDQKRKIENTPDIDEEKLSSILKNINDLRKERQQFLKDYMEQQYAPEVHEALDMLYDDLGGFTAWDYMGPVLSRIEDINDRIDQENDESVLADLYKQLDDQNFELTRLSSLYEKSPDSREFKVAEQLKKRSKLLGSYSNFILTDKAKQHFEAEKARIQRRLDKGEITKQRYERWLEDNTITELTPEYWQEKRAIIQGINEVANKLGVKSDKNEELGKLYSDIEDIVKAHRDNSGIINGQSMEDKEIAAVKSAEEQIEKIKDNIANIMGLTKLERIELANLYQQRGEVTEKILLGGMSVDPTLDDERIRLTDRIENIQSKKKKLDKVLLEEYFKLIKQLSELDQTSDTKYYMDEVEKQTQDAKWKIDISKMPNKFMSNGKTYYKNGNDWIESSSKGMEVKESSFVEDIYRTKEGAIALAGSDWWKNNHITRIKFVANQHFDANDPTSSTGEWQYVEEPLYPWRQTRPRDSKYISQDQPSIKYKKRVIKDDYKNPNYREDLTGNIQPKVEGAKDNRFINQDYNNLDSPSKKYLKFLTDTYTKAQDAIPKPLRPGYVLPSIRKSELERFFSAPINSSVQDTFARLGQMLRGVKDAVKKNEQDKDILFGYNDDYNGIVPVKFIGKIDSDDQSIDLAKSILLFAIEAKKREQLIKSLPFANAVRNIANDKEYSPAKTKNGAIETIKRKFLPKGTELARRSEISNTAHQINEIIKSEIYGENQKDQPGTKTVDTALHLGATIMLGFNFVSSVQNYANAFTQSIMETESANSRAFTMKNFYDAQKIYYGHMNELMADLGKYGNKSYINQFFDYFGGINFKIFSKNNKNIANGAVREFVSSLSVPNTVTEHMLNYHMAIAVALNYRVKATVDGKETTVPIFEAFTLKDRHLEIKPGIEVSEADRKEMISRLNSTSRRVNGEYGDKVLMDKYILGRMALFMNRYLIPFAVKRYGARKADIQDGITEEGYWRLFGKVLYKDLKAKSIPIISGWKYYTPEEKAAVIKATTEFGFTIMFSLMISALGGDDNKKLKDNSILTNNMIYALKGIQQQNESFMPIPGVGFDDILRKVQNPFPIFGKVKNLVSLMNDGTKTMAYEMGLPGVEKNDVEYIHNQGWHHTGDFKFMSDLEKLIGVQRLFQYMNPDQAIKNQDAMSRIK